MSQQKMKMPPLPFLETFHNKVERLSILGVGSDLRADDAAGVLVVRRLSKRLGEQYNGRLQLVDGGPAPENCTGEISAFRPSHLLLIDAADLQKAPGTREWLPLEALNGAAFSSHTLPLAFIINYILQVAPCTVSVIGIQPADMTAFSPVSPAVKQAVTKLVRDIESALPLLFVKS
jgi:hydrogenase maturation protease HycI